MANVDWPGLERAQEIGSVRETAIAALVKAGR